MIFFLYFEQKLLENGIVLFQIYLNDLLLIAENKIHSYADHSTLQSSYATYVETILQQTYLEIGKR